MAKGTGQGGVRGSREAHALQRHLPKVTQTPATPGPDAWVPSHEPPRFIAVFPGRGSPTPAGARRLPRWHLRGWRGDVVVARAAAVAGGPAPP